MSRPETATPTAAPAAIGTSEAISRAAVAALSAARGEPDWLRAQRLAAFDLYEQLPMPKFSRGIGQWWNTDIRAVHLDALDPAAPAGAGPLPADVFSLQEEHGGLLVQRNAELVTRHLDAATAGQGVIFTDLGTAVREHGALVEKYLSQQVAPGTDKFTALNAALWTGGTFLYVPRGVVVEVPLHSLLALDTTGAITLNHTLIIAEALSEVRLVEEFRSAGGDGLSPVVKDVSALAAYSGVLEVVLGEGSKVEYFTIENWGPEVYAFQYRRAQVGRDARMHWVFGVLGSRVTRAAISTALAGRGATTQTRGIYFTHGDQVFDLYSLTHHTAPSCTGDILFKGALRDQSQAGLEGMIRVEPAGQQTNSYLSGHIMFLSDQAKGNVDPGLEIMANDVRCSHGATIGQIDEDQIFYLQSRGLERVQAEKLIVGGFFEEVLQEMPLESMRDLVREQIQAKVALPKVPAA